MADNMIELVASLNVADSAKQINTVDIPKLQKKIEGIKIKCELDADGITSIQTQLNSISKNLKMEVPKVDMGLTGGGKDVINDVKHLADNVEKRISELKQNLAKEFGVDVDRIITNTVKNAQDQITSFSFDLTKLSGKVEKFNYEVNRKKDGDNVIATVKQTSSRDSDKGAIELLKKRNAEIDKLTQKLEKLRAGYSDQNAPRPILNEENILKLNNEFDETNKVIKEIKYSTSETFTKMVSDANKAISKYEELGKALRNAENTATDFSSKDITSAKSLLGGRIDSFVTQVSKSNIDDPQSIIQQAEAIKKSFDAIGDSQGLKTARDSFNKLRGEFESLDAVAKKSTFDKNLSNKVRKLTDNINNYAAANQRAIKSNKEMSNGKSFADEWSRIISEMAKGAELSDQEIKQLNVDLQSFKKNAKTAGLEGASAFEKFGNSFKLISAYISANQIINTVINQIRNAVTELQTVDERLTEISKTSDRSAESLRRLGQESFDAASQYGRTASDYLLGVQEMSRAGFGEQASEDMARLSVLAQAAGDMTANLSNQYLIATNAAYGYEGSVEKLNDVLDRQNYVTNHYALSMGDLAEATKIASSQAAQSGIGIDEMTAALSTMISTTQQGGEIASRALRGILMNIQQVKGEVGDGEEDITSDSLSKYEKAAAALGVALKEVRNGAVALRDPMVVLDELATAFNKEADNSVKKANLISAVGGKYRGNQLSALLGSWSTYKEILETYRSDAAIGSAAIEAEKSANNWTGSINKLKNSWAKLVNEFIKSDTAINTIQSLNTAVQSLTDSSVMDGLKTLATIFTSLVQLFGKASSAFGTLPTLIATISSIKTLTGGKPFILGLEELDKGTKKLTLFGKGLNDVSGGFLKAKAGALTAKAGVVALNAALSAGFSLAVGAAVSWITKLINKEKEAAEEAEKLRVEREQRLSNTVSEIKAYEEETKNIQDLVGQYIKLASTTENLSTAKDSLLPIQDQIVEKYGLEADAIDLVNGKLEDNIGLLLEQEKQRNESWLTDNRQTIKDAEDFFGQSLSLSTFKIDTLTEKSDAVKKVAVTEANIFYKSLKDALEEQNVSDLFTYNEDIIERQINNQAVKDLRYNISLKEGLDAEQTKRAIDAYVDAYKQLIEQKGSVADYFDLEGDRQDHVLGVLKQVSDYYDTLQTKQQMLSESESLESLLSGEDLKTYQDTVKQLTELSQTINDVTATPAKRQGARQSLEEQETVIRNLIEEYPALEDIATATLNNIGLTASGVAADEEQIYRDFLESLDNVHKGAMENINKIESAMVKLIKGEGLDHNSAWEILKLDTDKVLKPVIDSSGKYRFELDNIVALKDQVITRNKEIVMQDYNEIKSKKQLVDSELELIKLEFERTNIAIRGQSGGNSRPSESLVKQQDEQRKRIDELTRSSKAYADELERDSVLIREYNAHMGDLSGTTAVLQAQLDKLKKSQEDMKKQLDKLNKSADNLLKAQEYKIDQIIDKFQDEKDALEENKELLEEQLDTLEQQKQQIEDILKNYDDVADVISATVKDQVDEIKKNQDEVEKYYNDLIDKLKDENSERKDALDYAEKLAALENAKKNKVRVYGAATGWGYAVDRDALVKAQETLKQADDDKAIKELEKERDKRVKAYDDQIKGFEAYADEWSGIKDLLDREEKERLADELLGSEWREKIRNKDVKILNKFKNEYRSYNNQLSNLVNGEIATLKKSIESVDAEIKAKQKTIDAWNKYKKSVQDAATAAKNANEDYMKILDQVTINETSDLKARDNNLNAFKNHYIAYMNAISDKNKLIDDTTNKIEALTDQIAELSNDGAPAMDGLIDYLTSSIETIALALDAIGSTFADSALAVINGESYRGRAADIVRRLRGYKDGGSVDFTGMTMVHGTPNHSETVFNASQSKELYDMVKTGKFATQIENRVMQGLNRAFKPPTPTSNSTAVNISNMTIKADNPQQFHSQFVKEIHTYMDLKLNESYVK